MRPEIFLEAARDTKRLYGGRMCENSFYNRLHEIEAETQGTIETLTQEFSKKVKVSHLGGGSILFECSSSEVREAVVERLNGLSVGKTDAVQSEP